MAWLPLFLLLSFVVASNCAQLCPAWDGSVLANGATFQLKSLLADKFLTFGPAHWLPNTNYTALLFVNTVPITFTWNSPTSKIVNGAVMQMAVVSNANGDVFRTYSSAAGFMWADGKGGQGPAFYFAIIGNTSMYFVNQNDQTVVYPLSPATTNDQWVLIPNDWNPTANIDLQFQLYVCNNPTHVSIQAPPFVNVTATDVSGAVVTYSVSAVDTDTNQPVPVKCSRPSGGRFEYATTTSVSCSARGAVGGLLTVSFNVYVLPKYSSAYVGCWADQSTRDLPFYQPGLYRTEQCIGICGDSGYKYAGLQNGKECWCGNSKGTYGPSSSCNMNCVAYNGIPDTCGGAWANSVYAIYKPPYIGCYTDAADRDFLFLYLNFDFMTVNYCRTQCGLNGLKYAGLQYSTECYCGNSFGKYGLLPDSSCSMPCAGNSTEKCGGAYKNSVYSTGN